MEPPTNERRIWVTGQPRSQQAKRKHTAAYVESIRAAARRKFTSPLPASSRIEVSILFGDHLERPDVDNVGKLICDALKGIAYADDRQVQDHHVHVIDDNVASQAGADHNTIQRLRQGEQFVIIVSEVERSSVIDNVRTT